jgi:hypothetical protein
MEKLKKQLPAVQRRNGNSVGAGPDLSTPSRASGSGFPRRPTEKYSTRHGQVPSDSEDEVPMKKNQKPALAQAAPLPLGPQATKRPSRQDLAPSNVDSLYTAKRKDKAADPQATGRGVTLPTAKSHSLEQEAPSDGEDGTRVKNIRKAAIVQATHRPFGRPATKIPPHRHQAPHDSNDHTPAKMNQKPAMVQASHRPAGRPETKQQSNYHDAASDSESGIPLGRNEKPSTEQALHRPFGRRPTNATKGRGPEPHDREYPVLMKQTTTPREVQGVKNKVHPSQRVQVPSDHDGSDSDPEVPVNKKRRAGRPKGLPPARRLGRNNKDTTHRVGGAVDEVPDSQDEHIYEIKRERRQTESVLSRRSRAVSRQSTVSRASMQRDLQDILQSATRTAKRF